MFVGRMCAEKGAHRAIAVARDLGLPLKLAGKCRESAELEYFERNVRPELGSGIEYLGEVDHAEKLELLRSARAVLFPIDWEEPFGLVMVEAMACGAPVIATRRGAVPEVIDDGVTGVVVDDWRAMADGDRPSGLDRPRTQREVVEARFSQARMVADYEDAFDAAMAAWAGGGPAARRLRSVPAAAAPRRGRGRRRAAGGRRRRRDRRRELARPVAVKAALAMSDAILFEDDRVDHLESLADRPPKLSESMLLWVDLPRGSELSAAEAAISDWRRGDGRRAA